jgi:gliding motility-associated-like protein
LFDNNLLTIIGTKFENLLKIIYNMKKGNGLKWKAGVSILLTILSSALKAQPGCPNIVTSSSTPSVGCGGPPCATLTASAFNIGQTTTYSVASIPFAPPYPITGSGIGVSVGTDDVWSPIINLPFPFCYFGSTYNQCVIGSNGVISFNTSYAGGYCPWSYSALCPSSSLPLNAIFGPYHDIDPSVCGSVTYTLIGTAPCRMLVVNFNQVCHFSCTSLKSSFQMVLYETTNVIEVYVQNKPTCSSWNSGNALIGIQNAAGSVGYTPPGRNTGAWTVSTPEAWRFVPTGPSIYGPIQWYDASGMFATGNSVVVCPNTTTTYTAVTTYTRCDGLNITVSSPITISAFNSMTTSVASTNASCSSGTLSSGSATVSVVGGTSPITYSWVPSGGTSSVATGLSPGSYTCLVSDGSGNCTSIVTVTISSPAVPSFSISLNDDTLTCSNPTISATAVNTNTNISSMSYTFTSISSGTFAGNPYTVSTPGTYTVIGQDPSTGCVTTSTFAVGVYTSVPSVTVTPNSINIPCNGTAGTFTGSANPSTNVTYSWLQPGGGVLSGNLLTPGFAGTYTFVATNIANGCSNTYTVAATQSTAAPTMTLTATNNNFNIKCNPNTVTLTINATQAAGGGAPQVYWSNGTSTLSTANTFTFNSPGNYIGCAYDPSPGGCTICQTVTIGMDTLRPSGGYTLNVPTNTLTCTYSTAVITGTSPVSGVTYIWYTPGTVPQQTLSVNSTTNISQTTIGTYTVEITNPSNGCKTKIPVTMFQDKQPLGLTAKATPTALTCKDLQTTLQFTPNPISEPLTFTWTTPSPTSTNNLNNPITYYSAGTYSLCVTKNSNGCSTCTTVLVGSNTTPPSTFAVGPYTIQCGSTVTTIEAGTTPSTNITYLWSGPKDATLSTLTGYSTTVNMPGNYFVTITNTVTGCIAFNTVSVVNGTIDASFNPNPSSGFAPMSVSFSNNSTYGNPANLNYYWVFGNGSTITTTANASSPLPGTFTTYYAPGTYTVVMIMQNGTCIDTAYRIIKVDILSDMEVPNVFTPNGDGVNDYFILHTSNLTEIECTIIDRWGVEMYKVTTDKGNIQWDGKNKAGKEAPTGTYFYIIKAKGLDGKEYEEKGYLTLLR